LFDDIEAGAKARQRLGLGGIGEAVEERAVRKHGHEDPGNLAGGQWRFS
jgi:hypothetical protein